MAALRLSALRELGDGAGCQLGSGLRSGKDCGGRHRHPSAERADLKESWPVAVKKPAEERGLPERFPHPMTPEPAGDQPRQRRASSGAVHRVGQQPAGSSGLDMGRTSGYFVGADQGLDARQVARAHLAGREQLAHQRGDVALEHAVGELGEHGPPHLGLAQHGGVDVLALPGFVADDAPLFEPARESWRWSAAPGRGDSLEGIGDLGRGGRTPDPRGPGGWRAGDR